MEYSHIWNKIPPDWLPNYIKAAQAVLEIFKMAFYVPDRTLRSFVNCSITWPLRINVNIWYQNCWSAFSFCSNVDSVLIQWKHSKCYRSLIDACVLSNSFYRLPHGIIFVLLRTTLIQLMKARNEEKKYFSREESEKSLIFSLSQIIIDIHLELFSYVS